MIQAVGLTNAVQPLTASASKDISSTPAELNESFSNILKSAIDSVAGQEQAVHNLTNQYIAGQVDLETIMIASQKAELSLKLTSQVRNRVIEAYQEIMRTQL